MPMIDADTHVDESEATWKKLDGTPFAKYIPVTLPCRPRRPNAPAITRRTAAAGWLKAGCRTVPSAMKSTILLEFYENFEDVPGRLAHMDKMGVAVQVIFPTFFIRYNTSNAEAEWALTTTYNRWLAEKCAQDKRPAAMGGCAAAASSRQGCRGAALGEKARCLRHLQARIRPRQEGHRPALFSNLRGSQRARPAAVHPHRPSASRERMGPGLSHHVLLHRAGDLWSCQKVPETSVWAD